MTELERQEEFAAKLDKLDSMADHCPYCAGEVITTRDMDGEDWFMCCDKCLARGPLTSTPETALEAWNGREG